MTRNQKQLGRISTLVAILGLGLGSGLAQGAESGRSGWRSGDHRDHHSQNRYEAHRHDDRCGCEVSQTAGFITINGCKTRIVSGRGMLAQVARAFRDAGYRAWIQDNCVHVDYGCGKPSVRWQGDGYSVSLKWGWDTLGFSLRERYVPVREVRRVVRPVHRVYSRNTCGW